MAREIRKIVNFSQHTCWSEVGRAHQLLDRAFESMSGLQQPPHSDSEAAAKRAEKEYEEGMRQVEDWVRDIAMAVLGVEIDFRRTEPNWICEDCAASNFAFEGSCICGSERYPK